MNIIKTVIKKYKDWIMNETLCINLKEVDKKTEDMKKITINNEDLYYKIKKV